MFGGSAGVGGERVFGERVFGWGYGEGYGSRYDYCLAYFPRLFLRGVSPFRHRQALREGCESVLSSPEARCVRLSEAFSCGLRVKCSLS